MPSFISGAISKLPFLNAGTFTGCNLILLLLSIQGGRALLPAPTAPRPALTVHTGVRSDASPRLGPGDEDAACLAFPTKLCFSHRRGSWASKRRRLECSHNVKQFKITGVLQGLYVRLTLWASTHGIDLCRTRSLFPILFHPCVAPWTFPAARCTHLESSSPSSRRRGHEFFGSCPPLLCFGRKASTTSHKHTVLWRPHTGVLN